MTAASPTSSTLPPDEAAAMRPADPAWLVQARELTADLYTRRMALYWVDLLLSAGAAWSLTAIYFLAPAWSAAQVLAFIAAGFLFFRAGTFIHELVHMQPQQARWFGRVWNLLMGIPLLAPWVMYRNHVDHHSAKYFGTPDDGEYLPLASSPLRETIKYLVQAPLLPIFILVRFGLLGPLSWLHRGLREFVLTYTSAAVSNPYYRKRFPTRDERHLLICEVLCFAYLVGLGVAIWSGAIPLVQVLKAYILMSYALGLNWVRNLAAHRYGNRGERMTHLEQFADSINITGQTWLTVLMFPVGLRYHATHHLFPSMPYHNLGEAHRRLSRQLPADAPYHATGRESFFAAVAELWRSASRTAPKDSAVLNWLPQNRRA